MQVLDWAVLITTLALIIIYGMWKSRSMRGSHNFLAGQRNLPWWTIGLSVMSTQASAITFLSTPGQGYAEGMQFAQFYFGMPIAMIILVLFVLPIYYRLRVTTAYEYLEQRFDLRMRSLTAGIFLLLRGISAAISIYAPSIILSAVFGWSLEFTNFLMAAFVIFYTTTGGAAAVSRTQELQMTVMMGGLILAFVLVLNQLPEHVGLGEAWQIASVTGKTQVVDWSFDWHDRYNIWSGILGATFLFLSYFGTDQSQVGRYLSGRSLRESRLGLMFNGIVKIPMQFMVLAVGVMVFVFYQYTRPPLYFHEANREKITRTSREGDFQALERRADTLFIQKQSALNMLTDAWATNRPEQAERAKQEIRQLEQQHSALHNEAIQVAQAALPGANPKDRDYVFITYVMDHIPTGLIGLMLAMIFCASWGTTSSEINALTAASISDIYRRNIVTDRDDTHYMRVARWATVAWGGFIMVLATYVTLSDNLIQAVNMIGSLFYGTLLGIFFTAFFLKNVGGKAVFWAAVIALSVVFFCFFCVDKNAYLWYNPLGCGLVMGISLLLQAVLGGEKSHLGKNNS
ncbi:MAG: sodium:solute symporter [Saprospiraceae bacterium]|nr:sodium:solute symporter [Saprospiraceae bacterium]